MPVSDTHTENLRMYVNDMAALERDLHAAIVTQRDDARLKADVDLAALIGRIHIATHARMREMESHSAGLSGGVGATVKEAITTATGALAGLYGKVRKHPVSRMLRDDHVALSLAATGYSMLYTTALAVREMSVATAALANLKGVTPFVMELSRILPEIVVRELAEDDPDVDHRAAEMARVATINAWSEG